jgi:glucose-1-phosphate adenylyltransferase
MDMLQTVEPVVVMSVLLVGKHLYLQVIGELMVEHKLLEVETIIKVDGRVTDIYMNPTDITGNKDVSMNIIVMGRRLLGMLVHDAIAHNYTSFNRDIIGRNLSSKNIMIYRWEGYYSDIFSFEDYFAVSMDLISDASHRESLFSVKNRPIFTKVRNSPPTFYGDASEVRNSLIADGCRIEGTVENSILFRGVNIGRGAVIKNSILFQGAQIQESAQLNCVVSDKNTVIRSRNVLSGCEIEPYYIPKGKMI